MSDVQRKVPVAKTFAVLYDYGNQGNRTPVYMTPRLGHRGIAYIILNRFSHDSEYIIIHILTQTMQIINGVVEVVLHITILKTIFKIQRLC